MSARLTVVLDDEDLYRRLKIQAARDGVSMKEIVEAGLRHELEAVQASQPLRETKVFDWERYETLLQKWAEEDEAIGSDVDYPTDLSDVKHYLYGYPKAAERRAQQVAEERMEYDSQE